MLESDLGVYGPSEEIEVILSDINAPVVLDHFRKTYGSLLGPILECLLAERKVEIIDLGNRSGIRWIAPAVPRMRAGVRKEQMGRTRSSKAAKVAAIRQLLSEGLLPREIVAITGISKRHVTTLIAEIRRVDSKNQLDAIG